MATGFCRPHWARSRRFSGPRTSRSRRLPGREHGLHRYRRGPGLRHRRGARCDSDERGRGLNQPHEPTALVDALGGLAERAAARGLRLGSEPMPIASIPRLADGWDPHRQPRQPRARPSTHGTSGGRNPTLATISAGKIFDVQLVDGAVEPVGGLLNDLMHHRLLAGRRNIRPGADGGGDQGDRRLGVGRAGALLRCHARARRRRGREPHRREPDGLVGMISRRRNTMRHGWPQTWSSWVEVMPLLAEEFDAIALDLLRVGGSDKP